MDEFERSFKYGWHAGMDAYRQRLLGKLQPHIQRDSDKTLLSIEWRELLDILRSIR